MGGIMREIKFRAWDRKNKSFIKYIVGVRFYPGGIIVDYQTEAGFEETECGDAIPIQYTGLKDKNKKEIYEGDILKTSTDKIGVIMWDECMWTLKLSNENWIVSPGYDEIIGNIYENPELLK